MENERRARGTGSVRKIAGSRFWYIFYYRDGKQIRESSKSEMQNVAEKLLTSYSDRSYVSEDYSRELSAARTQALEVEQVSEIPLVKSNSARREERLLPSARRWISRWDGQIPTAPLNAFAEQPAG